MNKATRPLYCGASLCLLIPQAFGQEAIYNAAAGTLPQEGFPPSTPIEDILFEWGPVRARPRIGVGTMYDSNIRLRPRGEGVDSDFILTIAPGISVGLGDLLEREGNLLGLDYAATLAFFKTHNDLDSVNHNLSFIGQWHPPKLRLRLQHVYDSAEGAVRDVGDYTSWEINTTTLSGLYDYSEKLLFGMDAVQSINDWASELNSYNQWRLEGYADWKFAPKTSAGLGLGARWRTADMAPDMAAERVTLRASYAPGAKRTISAAFGYEFQQWDEGDSPDPTPILSVSGTYEFSEKTTFFLEGHRHNDTSVNPSFAGDNVTLTGFSMGAMQLISPKLRARAGVGYEFADYGDGLASTTEDREDSYVPVRAELVWNIYKSLAASLVYTFRYNSSSVNAYDFEAHQTGIRFDYSF